MWKYHVTVWSIALAFAFASGYVPKIYGFWFIDTRVDDTAICWIRLHKINNPQANDITPFPFIMFYIPISCIYFFSLCVLVTAYQRLRHGISQTILHRMRALVSNAINVSLYMAYWLVLGISYGLAFKLADPYYAGWMFKLLLFMISSKGVSGVFVWIFTVDVQFGKGEGYVEERVDLNSALRQEVLHSATAGIRHCAAHGPNTQENESQIVINLTHPKEKQGGVELSAGFFLCLILGRKQERDRIRVLAERRPTVHSSVLPEPQVVRESFAPAPMKVAGPPRTGSAKSLAGSQEKMSPLSMSANLLSHLEEGFVDEEMRNAQQEPHLPPPPTYR